MPATNRPGRPSKAADSPSRHDRLAAALRANLARRKAQARRRAEAPRPKPADDR